MPDPAYRNQLGSGGREPSRRSCADRDAAASPAPSDEADGKLNALQFDEPTFPRAEPCDENAPWFISIRRRAGSGGVSGITHCVYGSCGNSDNENKLCPPCQLFPDPWSRDSCRKEPRIINYSHQHLSIRRDRDSALRVLRRADRHYQTAAGQALHVNQSSLFQCTQTSPRGIRRDAK